jgi:hypothetical protein
MKLSFKFNNNNTNDSINVVFKKYFEWFKKNHAEIYVIQEDVSRLHGVYQGSSDSGQFLTIKNLENNKYIVVSYWDRASDLTKNYYGWDYENCVDLICSCGWDKDVKYTPFTYIIQNKTFYDLIETEKTNFKEKKDYELLFRGKLYGFRLELQKIVPNHLTDQLITPKDYFKEISSRKISLSLNGAAEICHRDMEIMATGSVLLRPELKIKFHNDLLPWIHYIPLNFDENSDVKTKWGVIQNIFNEFKDKDEILNSISQKSQEWFYQNATINQNIELLKKLIDINKLI